jgi:quercetin dioxygenase-like cupin family protein
MTEAFRKQREPFRWNGVEVHAYKAEGSAPYKDIIRQTLFAAPGMAAELRYFEIAPGGHSTLERHEHSHAVMIVRGRGRCLVGAEVRAVTEGDLVFVAPMTWHQFRAVAGEHLGFLCMVDRDRDRPQLPSAGELEALLADPDIAAFINSN